MKNLIRRLRYLLNHRRFDQELANDMEFHREMAAREGNRNFGNALRLREEARDEWGWVWIDSFLQDLRYAARMLQHSPGFTLTAIAMLALGIGINVAAFGFFNLMVLRPLPVRDPATLLQFQRESPGNFADNFAYPEVAFYSEHSKTLSAVLAESFGRLTVGQEEEPINASFLTANFFNELGAVPKLGRLLSPALDEAQGAAPVVVLSYGIWRSRFGADPSIVGKTILLNKKPATIVGVLSNDFSGLGLEPPKLSVPIVQEPYFVAGQDLAAFSEKGINVQMWGRLRSGLTPRIAEQELASLAAQLRVEHPKDIWEKETLPSRPGGFAVTVRAEMYPVLAIASALGTLILVAACVTLGGLLLARGVAREREFSIRSAVGAGRGRLIRQLLTESLLLAFLGLMAGLMAGYLGLRSLIVWADLPAWLNPMPDGRVILFAAGIGLAAVILFALTPAWHVARQRYRTTTIRQILIGAQVATSCVLLIVSGLLIRALNQAMSTSPGFEYERVIAFDPGPGSASPKEARAYLDSLHARLGNMPGILSMSMASNPPLGNRWSVVKTRVDGKAVNIHFNNVDPQFFQTMAIPVLRGRALERGDKREIVVSESLARAEWPGENPIGKRFSDTKDIVVGVVGNARLVSPEDSDAVEAYRLAQEDLLPAMVVLIRTAGPAEPLVPIVASVSKSIDPRRFPEIHLLRSSFNNKVAQARYAALTVSVLGAVALLLACLGIVGLVTYAVSQRTKEIGIRMALGAQPSQVLSVVLRQFASPIVVGLLVGIGGAAALSQILRQELYGLSNFDPAAYAGAVVAFAIAAGLAALLPARRALQVDPMLALRYE
jgi:predicted permease